MRRVVRYLQNAHVVRGFLYLSTFAVVYEGVGRLQVKDVTAPYVLEKFHLTILPAVATLTYGFAQLRADDRSRWVNLSVQDEVLPAAGGAVLGGSGLLALLLVGRLCRWFDAPQWGWTQHSVSEVGRSVAFIALGHLAVAWNEETVFRGYGYTTLRRAMPAGVVGVLLTLLFGYYHSDDLRIAAGELPLGVTLMLLRAASGGIAVPIGYHWAWNFFQTGVFGPANAPPSIRPLRVHGPALWVGRPGTTEPSLLSSIVNLVVACCVALWLYQRHRKRSNSK